MIADIFTKQLGGVRFPFLRDKIGVFDRDSWLGKEEIVTTSYSKP